MGAYDKEKTTDSLASFSPFFLRNSPWQQAFDYCVDAWQRQILFFDILRERGNIYFEQKSRAAPNVLHFDSEVLIDGRDLPRPVNYMLMRILPPEGVTTDVRKRPFVIFDPRAGHGPGIGGMKKESEIGIALRDGHPVYFVSFLPDPVPEQTIEDVCAAEALFVSKIIAWHPDADKPCLIGNCQAGWQIALMSSICPNMPGVLILAGAPLSYWAGVHGKNPMRYTGGILGGSWLNAMIGDLGNGIFDGAWLVHNFELNNPSNTYWTKQYNVYANADTEGPRFLEFERWWGCPVLLNAKEMHFITDELFIGNHLAAGKIHTSSGLRVDLRNIKSPIVIFCSHGDDITPPQQALDWILDLYATDDDIVANGQTIIYSLHDHIGHLGIFVSATVATKEHLKFISNIDMIEMMPPGLYEAKVFAKDENAPNADLASGDYIIRFEKRTLDDIRALGHNDEEDDRRFETVARLSENLQGLYDTFLAPAIRATSSEQMAKLLQTTHPSRVRFAFFSDKNPLFAGLPALAAQIKQNRRPVAPDNMFWKMQEAFSDQVVRTLDAINDVKNHLVEAMFLTIYGSPFVQASVGLRTVRPYAKPKAERDVQIEQERNKRLLSLQSKVEEGGLAEATVRGVLYIMRGEGSIDEREFRMLARLQNESGPLPKHGHAEYMALARQQYMMLLLDEERAIRAIPNLLDRAGGKEKEAFSLIRRMFEASGTPSLEEQRRLRRLEELFSPACAVPHRRTGD